MCYSIPIDQRELLRTIDEFRREAAPETAKVLTKDIICKYSGGFYLNETVPPVRSINALFGKLLMDHHEELGIRQLWANVPIKDCNGNPTTCSEWEILPNTKG